jgi:hypothetical protein
MATCKNERMARNREKLWRYFTSSDDDEVMMIIARQRPSSGHQKK